MNEQVDSVEFLSNWEETVPKCNKLRYTSDSYQVAMF